MDSLLEDFWNVKDLVRVEGNRAIRDARGASKWATGHAINA